MPVGMAQEYVDLHTRAFILFLSCARQRPPAHLSDDPPPRTGLLFPLALADFLPLLLSDLRSFNSTYGVRAMPHCWRQRHPLT